MGTTSSSQRGGAVGGAAPQRPSSYNGGSSGSAPSGPVYLTPDQIQSLFLTGQRPDLPFAPFGILPSMVPPLPPPR
jgi:hypothetical protein